MPGVAVKRPDPFLKIRVALGEASLCFRNARHRKQKALPREGHLTTEGKEIHWDGSSLRTPPGKLARYVRAHTVL